METGKTYINAREVIGKFEEIEARKRGLLENLESCSKKTPRYLQELFLLLKRDEIPLLNIVLGELDSMAGSMSNDTNLLDNLEKVRKAAGIFLKKAENDCAKTEDILERLKSVNGGFYMKNPKNNEEASSLIKSLAKALKSNIMLEEILKVDDAKNILGEYAKIAWKNEAANSGYIANALEKGSLPMVAACFVILLSCSESAAPNASAPADLQK